jgi:hypothetical protein
MSANGAHIQEFYLPGYNAVQSDKSLSTFRRNMSPPISALFITAVRTSNDTELKLFCIILINHKKDLQF